MYLTISSVGTFFSRHWMVMLTLRTQNQLEVKFHQYGVSWMIIFCQYCCHFCCEIVVTVVMAVMWKKGRQKIRKKGKKAYILQKAYTVSKTNLQQLPIVYKRHALTKAEPKPNRITKYWNRRPLVFNSLKLISQFITVLLTDRLRLLNWAVTELSVYALFVWW